MKNEVQVYQDKLFQLSAVLDEKNESWFLANDVCKCLALSNISRALDGLEDEWKARITISNPCYDKNVNGSKKRMKVYVVNESGLYKLIFKSTKEEAKNFQKWVFTQVLPSIRKNGYYNLRREELKPTYKDLASNCFLKEHNKSDALQTLERVINMVNRAITGMSSQECKEKYNLSPRDWIYKNQPEKLKEYDRLQTLVNGEIERGRELLQIRTTLKTMGYKI